MSQLAYSTSGVSVVTTQQVYPGIGSFSISSSGKYGFNESLSLTNNAVSTLEAGSSITLTGAYNYTPSPGIIYLYSFTQTLKPTITTTTTTVIMNLLGGQANWYKPHIYVGWTNNNQLTNQWPIFYPSGKKANKYYWRYASATLSVANPILELVPNTGYSGGMMLWNSTYTSGQVISITMEGTFTNGTAPADGFEIYLFIPPGNGWEISSSANYSIIFTVTAPSGIQGTVLAPLAGNGTYLIIQWDPFYAWYWNTSSDFNIFVVTVSNGQIVTSQSHKFSSVGSGALFVPNPGDIICFTVSYNPSTNTITAFARDLNTGQVVTLNYSLNGYFTPPASGLYLFGISGNTGGKSANWGALYVAQSQS
jgi:hypothetical protein